MNEILRFLKTYEVWVYVLLGLVGLVYVRKLILALIEWRGAIFGLERENAQRRLSEATSMIILLFLLAAGQFLLVSFVSPSLPDVQALATPTLNILATQTATLPVGTPASLSETLLPGTTLQPVTQSSTGCIADQLEFTFPESGNEIKGMAELKGTVSVEDFGFYKYEYTQPGSSTWLTIAAGNSTILDGILGVWDTSQLIPGDYLLRLVVTDHQGQELSPCVIPIRVAAP